MTRSMAGLLARGLLRVALLPGFPVAPAFEAQIGASLSAYSCGGSHGFGPFWVVHTVFPIIPLEFIRRGTIENRTVPP